MPSLLTNNRMHPALRARVLESLHSDARTRVGGKSQHGNKSVRILTSLSIVLVFAFLYSTYRESRAEFYRERAAIFRSFEHQIKPFDGKFRQKVKLIDTLLEQALAEYPGDLIEPALRESAILDELLEKKMAYLRGPIRAFQTQRDRRSASSEGGADGLIRCFLKPPPAARESDLLRHLGHIYQPATFRDRFANVDRAFHALEFIDSSFKMNLNSARTMRQLLVLSRQLQAAKLGEAKEATKAELFVYVLDEPKEKGVPADFDGEAEHEVRITFVNLDTSKVLLRVRRRVDPEWLSEKSRVAYSRELDSCRLASELRQELRK